MKTLAVNRDTVPRATAGNTILAHSVGIVSMYSYRCDEFWKIPLLAGRSSAIDLPA